MPSQNPLEPQQVEKLLREIPLAKAPEALWDDIQAELREPKPAQHVHVLHRPMRSPLLAAAAILLALIGGAYAGVVRMYAAPSTWEVRALLGVPTIDGASLAQSGGLAAGEWLITDSLSAAGLTIGNIGTASIGPNSRLRLAPGGLTEHRLALERGSLDAIITAPPRLFFVETPAVLATDLGCAYTLEVDSVGTTRIHVTAGWVELGQGATASLVPAGLIAEVEVGGRPGTPYPETMSVDARDALHRLDLGGGSPSDLALVLEALAPPSAFITVKRQSAITLWHLVQRLDGAMREATYERLAELQAPPADVTMEGILALERPMLERWRRDLNPMWSEEAQPLFTRIARRLWNWTMR